MILVLSPYWKKEVCETFELNNQVRVLYNPCTSITDNTSYEKQPYILYAGGLIGRKGYADLIRAFSLISNQFPNWKLVFAGNGEIEKAKQLTHELKIEDKVHFLGWINGKDKDKAFKEASIFRLPSYAEGFPMAVLDAWAYGLPVVSTPVGGLTDISIDEKNILLFPPGEINKLSEQLNKMISNESLRNYIASASKDLSCHIFHEKVINRQLGELYKKTLECNVN
jgi:glycosyltransferase involved in cell wall biosynthesis